MSYHREEAAGSSDASSLCQRLECLFKGVREEGEFGSDCSSGEISFFNFRVFNKALKQLLSFKLMLKLNLLLSALLSDDVPKPY